MRLTAVPSTDSAHHTNIVPSMIFNSLCKLSYLSAPMEMHFFDKQFVSRAFLSNGHSSNFVGREFAENKDLLFLRIKPQIKMFRKTVSSKKRRCSNESERFSCSKKVLKLRVESSSLTVKQQLSRPNLSCFED